MRNTKSAFTLVELIVVITILAILGTIAFISLQGYSAEARNSKRIQDLASISSSLNIKLTRGMSVLSAVATGINAASSINLAGNTGFGTGSLIYDAGKVNYTALEMKSSEFSDPQGDSYVIGATTLSGGPFQLAASIEADGGKTAKVSWSFSARGTGTVDTVSGTGDLSRGFFSIPLTDTGKFKVKDFTTQWNITKISTDGTTIYVDSVADWAGDIALAAAESDGLITSDGYTFIRDGGDALPY